MDATEPLLRELLGAVLREERRRQGRTLAQLAAAYPDRINPYL